MYNYHKTLKKKFSSASKGTTVVAGATLTGPLLAGNGAGAGVGAGCGEVGAETGCGAGAGPAPVFSRWGLVSASVRIISPKRLFAQANHFRVNLSVHVTISPSKEKRIPDAKAPTRQS